MTKYTVSINHYGDQPTTSTQTVVADKHTFATLNGLEGAVVFIAANQEVAIFKDWASIVADQETLPIVDAVVSEVTQAA